MRCKQCGKKELSLSDLGLCDICDKSFNRYIQILEEATNILNETKNITTFTNRCNIALGVLEKLKKFDHLNYIDPSASQLIDDILEKRSSTIFEYWDEHCMELSQKLESYKSIDKIIDTIEKAKEEFLKYEEYIQESNKINEIKLSIQSLYDDHIIGGYNELVTSAKSYEKRSNNKIAIKKLKDALNIFEKYKNYFGEGNQSLGIELKEWIERLEN